MRPSSLTILGGTCLFLGVILEMWYEKSRERLRNIMPQYGPSEPMSLYFLGLYIIVLAILERFLF